MARVLPVLHYRFHNVRFPCTKYIYLYQAINLIYLFKPININRKQHHIFSVLKVSITFFCALLFAF